MQYRVMWVIDVEAETHMEAALIAREVQQDPESLATVFSVLDQYGKFVKLDTNPAFRH